MLFISHTQLWHWLLVALGISMGAPPEYSFQVEAETQVEVEGVIRDAESGEGVPYAHILVIGRGQGTAANGEGRFRLPQELLHDDGIRIRVSAVGYETAVLEWQQIMDKQHATGTEPITLYLHPVAYEQDEAVVTASRLREHKMDNISFWWRIGFNRTSIGITMKQPMDEHVSIAQAQRVDLDLPDDTSLPVLLQELELRMFVAGSEEVEQPAAVSDSLHLRLRILEVGPDNRPGEREYLSRQVIKTVAAEKSRLRFDLSDEPVRLPEPSFFFIVELLIPEIEDYHGLYPFFAVNNNGTHQSLIRFKNYERWKPHSRDKKYELLYELKYAM